MEKLGELIQKHGIKEIYMECEQLSVAQARRFEAAFQRFGAQAVLDETLDSAIREQRMIKSPEEVKKIEASQEITTRLPAYPALHQRGRHRAGAGTGDRVLHAQAGRGKCGLRLIVAAGKNGSQCHAVPSDNTVQKGDFITMDTGACWTAITLT